MWGRLFTGHNQKMAEEFNFACRFARLNSQDRESAAEQTSHTFLSQPGPDEAVSEEREDSSQLFENIRAELDSIITSSPAHFIPEMNQVKTEQMSEPSQTGPRLRRKLRLVSSPDRLPRDLLEKAGVTEDLVKNALWATVGNGRVKIFPLFFGITSLCVSPVTSSRSPHRGGGWGPAMCQLRVRGV